MRERKRKGKEGERQRGVEERFERGMIEEKRN